MGVYYCSTGQHVIFISVSPTRSYSCPCPPNPALTQQWSRADRRQTGDKALMTRDRHATGRKRWSQRALLDARSRCDSGPTR